MLGTALPLGDSACQSGQVTRRRTSKPALRAVPAPAPATAYPAPLTHRETIDDLLKQSGRNIVPIRKAFVQQPPGSPDRAGPLAEFVTSRDARALDAYLFVHALASAEPWTCTYPSSTWARVLDLAAVCEPESAKAAVSKVFRRLEDRALVGRRRSGRMTELVLLHEDGSGEPYTRPKKAGDGVWLTLPYAYWRKDHYRDLKLPAKAMLLVALSLPEDFVLPRERMPAWYGLSADTADRGLRELRDHRLLSTRSEYVRDHKSPTGWREVQHHQLLGDYSAAARAAAAKAGGPRRRGRAAAQTAG